MMLIANGMANSLRNNAFIPAWLHEKVAASNFLLNKKNQFECILLNIVELTYR